MMKDFVAYYRVSTEKQGRSGLGLDAQRDTVRKFAAEQGRSIAAEFTEVESGKKDRRPKLAEAIEYAKANNATLIIAKLDRLSRVASFILALRDSGVDFLACDSPHYNSLTIGILALVAQDERERIVERTKGAKRAEKYRKLAQIAAVLDADVESLVVRDEYRRACQAAAWRLGCTAATVKARAKSIEVKKAAAAECPEWQRAEGYAKALSGQGKSLHTIAKTLNAEGFLTRKGRPFMAQTVKRLLAR
jgi:DNA invertase Pin-like site-specific DNA recombinase